MVVYIPYNNQPKGVLNTAKVATTFCGHGSETGMGQTRTAPRFSHHKSLPIVDFLQGLLLQGAPNNEGKQLGEVTSLDVFTSNYAVP